MTATGLQKRRPRFAHGAFDVAVHGFLCTDEPALALCAAAFYACGTTPKSMPRPLFMGEEIGVKNGAGDKKRQLILRRAAALARAATHLAAR